MSAASETEGMIVVGWARAHWSRLVLAGGCLGVLGTLLVLASIAFTLEDTGNPATAAELDANDMRAKLGAGVFAAGALLVLVATLIRAAVVRQPRPPHARPAPERLARAGLVAGALGIVLPTLAYSGLNEAVGDARGRAADDGALQIFLLDLAEGAFRLAEYCVALVPLAFVLAVAALARGATGRARLLAGGVVLVAISLAAVFALGR